MQRIDHHPVPSGPLAVRWLAYELEEPKAGTARGARVAFENAGSATWRRDPPHAIAASYHWLDEHGNPIVWEGYWKPLPHDVAPGERVELNMEVRAPRPPGRYRLSFDLVEDARWWFAEVGNVPLELAVDVGPRIWRELKVVVGAGPAARVEETRRALMAQEEPVNLERGDAVAYLAAGCLPSPDWSRRILDAHSEGFAVVGGSVDPVGGWRAVRGARKELAPWAPGTGRNPAFQHPLLCPSVASQVDPEWLPDVHGLPAAAPPAREPWLYDGRITVRLPVGRRRG